MSVSTAEAGPVAVAEFDAAPPADAAAELMPCCASRRWIAAVVKGRPYATLVGLTAASDAVLARLDWADIEDALSAHPRIGDRAAGADRESSWSRQEQSGTRAIDDDTRSALHDGNVAYQQRFGHVFLICATGLSAQRMLDALKARLRNDPIAEREVVRTELTKIVRIRLAKAFV